jgi:hypothetical protein
LRKRVLRRIFGPKRDQMTGGWIKLHNESCNLYSSPSIIRMLKSRKREMNIGVWWESKKDRDH